MISVASMAKIQQRASIPAILAIAAFRVAGDRGATCRTRALAGRGALQPVVVPRAGPRARHRRRAARRGALVES
ncbi:hypothetical protein BE15_39995 [Sorangium cellulosum]|uniref:Uncharacterized protein n=1 Tax=Sorangium cellulosum TaxID=56 RepID=A0A150Q2V8_SORCE|nr:hypothetical protein BE15_39995 [Sorangium cellulosum]